jgi:myosin-5
MLSLAELNSLIAQTGPHYVRCLKPNSVNVCDHFNPQLLAGTLQQKSKSYDFPCVCWRRVAQLKCNGVLEAVKVTRSGFSNRFPHKEFVTTFSVLYTG